MAIEVNKAGLEYAKALIGEGKVDKEREWHLMEPTPESEDAYLASVGGDMDAYGKWFLAINTDKTPGTKGYYEFPYGDFKAICRSGVIAAEQRAGQYHHEGVKAAALELKNMIDG